MIHSKTLISPPLLITSILLSISTCIAVQFVVTNNCPYNVWAASVPVVGAEVAFQGGGVELPTGASWNIIANPPTTGRIWGRTGCTAAGLDGLSCRTGDCGGLLRCTAYGSPPVTLAEFTLGKVNNLDFFDISLVDGFNVPMEFSPASNGCARAATCRGDVVGQCPGPLRAPGACHGPCAVFKTSQYCCSGTGSCGPTNYSRYFKSMCPDAYSYPMDDQSSTFTCPNGTDYNIVFCPRSKIKDA